jgi:hypothetical protein
MTSPAIPVVTITVQDNGASAALSVPLTNIQLVVGCGIASAVVNQPYATTNPSSLQTQYLGGPIVEAAGLIAQAGNVALCISCPIVTKGTAYAVQATVPGGSTSTITTSLDATNGAWDWYYVKIKCLTGGTIGVTGIVIQISLDAGRNYGSPISLGTANTLYLGAGSLATPAIGGTGISLSFGAGTLVANDSWQFGTVGPQWNDAGLQAAIAAYFASQYAVAGVGSVHIVGPCVGGSDIATIQTSLQAGTNGFVYQRAIVELQDVFAPTAWGGSGQTEAAWITNLALFTAGNTAQPRVCADAGWYNTPSPFANFAGGLPAYRRPLAWSHAVRRTQIPLQRRAARVKDGPYSTIVVNPASDPTDGFVYHNERAVPGLNAANLGSALTWPKKGQGFYQCQEPLLCAPGSQFVELVIGNVLDVACDIGYAAGVNEVSDDLLTQANGTLDPVALAQFQGDIQVALNQGMVQNALVSLVTAVVSSTQNVETTGIIPVVISVLPRGYANAITETINLATGF